MSKKLLIAIATSLTLLPLSLQAQDDTPATAYLFATYFMCSPDGESRADEIINTSFKPHYDAAVENGDILGWTWMQHYVGGTWRRSLVIVSDNIDSLLESSGALGEIISESTPEAGRAFSGICSAHEDYIWQTVEGIGSGGATDQRGAVGFSVYMQCDMAKEERVDELVRDVFAPIYDRHIGEGGFTTWNWFSHNVGGKYRRLLTLGATDHKSMMRARTSVLEEFSDGRAERAAKELNSICYSHDDYMWDILIQNQAN